MFRHDPAAPWLLLAVFYLLFGVYLGNYMGATGNHQWHSLHAHINLLGWASLALTGLIYGRYQEAARNRLGKIHFWSYNLTLPISLFALWRVLGGDESMHPLLGICSMILALSLTLFAVNLLLHFRSSATARAE